MSGDKVDALVIFGATGDLAKLETFPALVGLVERGVLDVPGDRHHPVATPERPGSGFPSGGSGPDVGLSGMVAPGK
jgi:glucose-6-phosphate dehydrogenase-like protein